MKFIGNLIYCSEYNLNFRWTCISIHNMDTSTCLVKCFRCLVDPYASNKKVGHTYLCTYVRHGNNKWWCCFLVLLLCIWVQLKLNLHSCVSCVCYFPVELSIHLHVFLFLIWLSSLLIINRNYNLRTSKKILES